MSRYSTEFLVKIFSKGVIIRGKNPNLYRLDKFGAEIYFYSYGRTSPKGWEVDHSKSVKRGGTNHLNNLQPLQWHNNRAKGAR